MHLRQPEFRFSGWGSFIKDKDRMQKLEKTGDSKYICQSELDKAFST